MGNKTVLRASWAEVMKSETASNRDARPRIDARRWAVVCDEAQRRQTDEASILRGMIDRLARGNNRGSGATGKLRAEVRALAGRIILNLVRYEGALATFVSRPTIQTNLAELEAEDHSDALAKSLLASNSALRDDVVQLRRLMDLTTSREEKSRC